MGFVFGTWNTGSEADYQELIRNREDASNKSPNIGIGGIDRKNQDDAAMLDSIDKVRNKLLAETAKDLARATDVLALQEVGGDKVGIEELQKAGFQIIRYKNSSNTDTAIAIHPDKFEHIENRSFNSDVAVAVATEKSTGKKIAFISGHIAGFNLEEDDEELLKLGARAGDQDIKTMIKKLKAQCADCDTVCIGADMNAFPEKYADRFQLLENERFKLKRTGKPTNQRSRNFDGKTAILQERELDYVFVLDKKKKEKEDHHPFLSFLNRLFKKDNVKIIPPKELNKLNLNLTLDPISSPSDHIPVFVRIHGKVVKENLFSNMFAWIGSLFGRVKPHS